MIHALFARQQQERKWQEQVAHDATQARLLQDSVRCAELAGGFEQAQ
jgi:hypothetical protein